MSRYPLIQRILHWSIALVVILVLAGGLTIDAYGFEGLVDAFGQGATNLLYKYHKTFGIIVLAAMALRIIVKLRLGKPAYVRPLTKFERIASNAVHGLFYVLLVAQPVLGWLATGASDFPVEFFGWTLPPILPVDKALGETLYSIHGVVGRILLALIVIHISAALMHGLVKQDGVLRRML